ncbi:MAG: hypothetical protein ACRD1Y_06060, partial [Terriglobales bacterium]
PSRDASGSRGAAARGPAPVNSSANPADLAQYRQRLFRLLYRDRSRLFDPERALFPQAYLHNLEEGAGRRLPNPRVWVGVLVLVFVVWWGAAQLGWDHITAPLQQAICQLNPHASGCAPASLAVPLANAEAASQ